VNDLKPSERFAELFNRHCFERELDKSLAGLVNGLGAPFTDNESYLAALEAFLDSASSIPKWLISASESSVPDPDTLNALISKFKKNVSMRSKQIFYSKNLIHTEYLFVAQG
jgi:methionine synthase II (cobalamin-independent)